MTDAKKRYIRKFSKKLTCSKQTRLNLSDGLEDELLAYKDLSYKELCNQIGTPEQIASQMMENISQDEIKKAKRIRFIPFLLIGCLITVLLVFLIAYYIHTQSVIRGDFYVKEETVVSETTEISDGMLE